MSHQAPQKIVGSAVVSAPPVQINASALVALIEAPVAPVLYRLVQREAQMTSDTDARISEVILAVTFMETYIVEWVRDEILRGERTSLDRYFHTGEKSTIDRWKKALKKSATKLGIDSNGIFCRNPEWEALIWLAKLRNDLIHAHFSIPQVIGQASEVKSETTLADVYGRAAGESKRVIDAFMYKLHAWAGTQLPSWLTP